MSPIAAVIIAVIILLLIAAIILACLRAQRELNLRDGITDDDKPLVDLSGQGRPAQALNPDGTINREWAFAHEPKPTPPPPPAESWPCTCQRSCGCCIDTLA